MLTKEVKELLASSGNKILIITIGNTFRSDDGAGTYIAANLKKLLPGYILLNAFDRPENIIDEAVSVKPDKTIIIDAANFNGTPGEARIITAEQIPNTTLSTHTFPLNIIAKILEEDTGSNVYFLGIQGQSFDFGEGLSARVKETADEIVKILTCFK